MSIVILAPSRDVVAERIAQACRKRSDAPVHLFPVEPEGDVPATIDGAAPTMGGVTLDAAARVYVTGFRYENPVIPPEGNEVDWSFWQARHVLRQQSHSFMWSLLSRAEAHGAALVNPPSALLNLFSREHPLDMLRAAGFRTADVTMTNDPELARALLERNGILVWRPINGRAAWQLFREKQRAHLTGDDKAPILIAPIVAGPVLRVYVMDGAVSLILNAAPPAREGLGLERFELMGSMSPDEVPGIDGVIRAAETLGLRGGVFTVVASEDGLVIYDVDGDPVFDDLPAPFRSHLIDTAASWLTDTPPPPPPIDLRAERSTLMLRRMLVIQFDIEATKHTD